MTIWKKDATQVVTAQATEGTMIDHLGIEVVEIGDNWIKARMPVDSRTVQPQRRLHGGASVALLRRGAARGDHPPQHGHRR